MSWMVKVTSTLSCDLFGDSFKVLVVNAAPQEVGWELRPNPFAELHLLAHSTQAQSLLVAPFGTDETRYLSNLMCVEIGRRRGGGLLRLFMT